jgi:hypothetical protein
MQGLTISNYFMLLVIFHGGNLLSTSSSIIFENPLMKTYKCYKLGLVDFQLVHYSSGQAGGQAGRRAGGQVGGHVN